MKADEFLKKCVLHLKKTNKGKDVKYFSGLVNEEYWQKETLEEITECKPLNNSSDLWYVGIFIDNICVINNIEPVNNHANYTFCEEVAILELLKVSFICFCEKEYTWAFNSDNAFF